MERFDFFFKTNDYYETFYAKVIMKNAFALNQAKILQICLFCVKCIEQNIGQILVNSSNNSCSAFTMALDKSKEKKTHRLFHR